VFAFRDLWCSFIFGLSLFSVCHWVVCYPCSFPQIKDEEVPDISSALQSIVNLICATMFVDQAVERGFAALNAVSVSIIGLSFVGWVGSYLC
jgi:hypothetical protein